MKNRIYKVVIFLLLAITLVACGEEKLLLNKDGSLIADDTGREESVIGEDGAWEEALEQENGTLYVHICGAVVNPGVYELPSGSRINDAVLMAGDFDSEADREAINLVQELSDGEQIRIPFIGESDCVSASGLININTANREELCQIPGIGESRADAIISYRDENGRFESVKDLMRVPGIKEGIYARVSTYIECK